MMKKPNSVGYFSAYYRGLECLLDMWLEIRKQVPTATLDAYYGWESWVAFNGEDEFYERMEAKFADLATEGVTVHGRVSHEELAKAMQEIQVWAYPTEFEEIHCITALKAQEAGCIPVVTNVGALAETVKCGYKVDVKDIYTNPEAQEQFIFEVVKSLKTPDTHIADVRDRYWPDVANKWSNFIEEKLSA